MTVYLTCYAMLQADGTYRATAEGQGILMGSLDNIFNSLSRAGWEMVNCFPASWTSAGDSPHDFDLNGIMAIFRRR